MQGGGVIFDVTNQSIIYLYPGESFTGKTSETKRDLQLSASRIFVGELRPAWLPNLA
jgi:hypothetical protein